MDDDVGAWEETALDDDVGFEDAGVFWPLDDELSLPAGDSLLASGVRLSIIEEGAGVDEGGNSETLSAAEEENTSDTGSV